MLILGIIFGFTEGFTSLILGILMIRIYFKTKIKATLNLVILVFSLMMNGFLFGFIMALPSQAIVLAYYIAYYNYIFLIIFAILSLISLYIFFDFIQFGRIRARLFGVYTSFCGAVVTTLFIPGQIDVFYSPPFSSWMINASPYLILLGGILGAFTLWRYIFGTYAISRAAKSKTMKKQFLLNFAGLTTALLGLIISMTIGFIVSNFNFIVGSIFRGIYPLFISAGLVLMFYGYYLNPYSVYSITQKVYQLIVYNENGVTIYDKEFLSSTTTQSVLVTGAIFGVASMLQTALGIKSHPRSLKYGDRTLIFEFKENIGFILISDKDSGVLRDGLRIFSENFINSFTSELKNWDGALAVFSDAIKLVRDAFPFLNT